LDVTDSLKTYVKTLHRHQRLMIFVDNSVSESSLRKIMEGNMHIWGGRYNPIVPVYNSKIAKEWLDVIEHFDPDFIYYSKGIDIIFLESLKLFHPKEYIEMREEGMQHFPGVNIHCLIHEHVHNMFFTNRSVLLQYEGAWDMEVIAKPFFQLNFGFRPFYDGEKRWTHKLDGIEIDKDNAIEINKQIVTQQPYFKSLLSALHINSVYLDRHRSWNDSRFEWIVYDANNYLNDLLYFWNRQLYFEPKNILTQVISTTEEVEELLKDQWFGYLLKHLSLDNQVSVVSLSLTAGEVKEIQKKMQAVCSHARIETKEISSFPFKPGNIQYAIPNYFKPVNNLILGKSDYLKLPDIHFENGEAIDSGPYAIDVVIEKDTKDEHKEIKFPYETELHFIITKASSRINKQHTASIFVTKDMQGVEFSIPSDFELIRSVLMFRKKNKELVKNPVDYITPSVAGQKLSAFFNLFDQDWSVIKQFLEERFWLQLFRYASEVKESKLPAGRGVFSYQDLIDEIEGLYSKYLTHVRDHLREIPEQQIDDELVNRYVARSKKEAFTYHIDSELNYLIARSALFMGMKVKCRQCGSNKWYSLTELKDKLACKGCNAEIIPNLESKIYYKLSDTIINNLLSDQITNHKHYDGNYVVLKTILHLREDSKQTGNSFLWTPCLDFSGKNGDSLIKSDLDILAIQNGKLVIGEAKCNAKEFSGKVKNSLIWAGNHLLPDRMIVSCAEGDLDNVVREIQNGLTDPNCKVVGYKIYPSWYHLPGIFGVGLPKKNNDDT
jgi:hypothetical protein